MTTEVAEALEVVRTAMRALAVARRRLEALPPDGQGVLPFDGEPDDDSGSCGADAEAAGAA